MPAHVMVDVFVILVNTSLVSSPLTLVHTRNLLGSEIPISLETNKEIVEESDWNRDIALLLQVLSLHTIELQMYQYEKNALCLSMMYQINVFLYYIFLSII